MLSQTINKEYYLNILHGLRDAIWWKQLQLWGTRDWQLHDDNVSTHTSCLMQRFWWNIESPRWVSPLQPRFGALQLLAFPKTKITLERGEISDHWWDSGKYNGAADGNWENCVRSQGAYFEGNWGIIVLCTMFFVSCIFFNKCLFFVLPGWRPSGQTS